MKIESDALSDIEVTCRRQRMALMSVPLGSEFVFGGRAMQMIAESRVFSQTNPSARFRYGDEWYMRASEGSKAYKLDPNMPCGKKQWHLERHFNGIERIALLVVNDRGPAA